MHLKSLIENLEINGFNYEDENRAAIADLLTFTQNINIVKEFSCCK